MTEGHPEELPEPFELQDIPHDLRQYLPYPKSWEAHIMDNRPREYCHFKAPGEDYFHLLLPGEVYLQYGHAKFCLNCARRFGHTTGDRLHWQRGPRRKTDKPL